MGLGFDVILILFLRLSVDSWNLDPTLRACFGESLDGVLVFECVISV